MNPHNIFINDLDAEVGCTITMLSDVIRLGGDVHCFKEQGRSQRNLGQRKNWTIFISVTLNELMPDSEGRQSPPWGASNTAQPDSQQRQLCCSI